MPNRIARLDLFTGGGPALRCPPVRSSALAEINVTGWSNGVATTGNGWYAAGVEARRKIAAAGYDVAPVTPGS
jgi:hypothetical protein